MSRRKYLVSVSILIGACVIYFLYLKPSVNNVHSLDVENSGVVPKKEFVDHDKPERLQNPPGSDSEETPEVAEKVRHNDDELIFLADMYSSFQLPDSGIPEYVAELLSGYGEDSSGLINMKLYKAFEYCRTAPKNEHELSELKRLYEDASLMAGADNGHIQRNVNRAEQQYAICTQITQMTSTIDPYFYLYRAAEKGFAYAQMGLATAYAPDDFSSWEEKRKKEYRKKMGKFLETARAQCEPRAFQAYAAAKHMGEGELWTDTNPVPDKIRSYANRLAYGMFYANKVMDGEGVVAQTGGHLDRLKTEMTAEEVEQAEQYGRYLYDKNCR